MDSSQESTVLDRVSAGQAAGFGRVELRQAPRFPMSASVRVGWVDTCRQMVYVTAQGVDLSETGLAVRMPVRLPPRTLVHLEIAGCGISVVGHVRYAVRPVGDSDEGGRVGFEAAIGFPAGAPTL